MSVSKPHSRYHTIVADPPWSYPDTWGITRIPNGAIHDGRRARVPYVQMPLEDIIGLPVIDLAEQNAHLYLWTTNRYLRDAFRVVESWGFRHGQTLVWAKPKFPSVLGGAFCSDVEFILFARRGTLPHKSKHGTSWWNWPRQGQHSRKPDAFFDLVEEVSPGPYLELFARRQRLGWDTWGNEALEHVELVTSQPPFENREDLPLVRAEPLE